MHHLNISIKTIPISSQEPPSTSSFQHRGDYLIKSDVQPRTLRNTRYPKASYRQLDMDDFRTMIEGVAYYVYLQPDSNPTIICDICWFHLGMEEYVDGGKIRSRPKGLFIGYITLKETLLSQQHSLASAVTSQWKRYFYNFYLCPINLFGRSLEESPFFYIEDNESDSTSLRISKDVPSKILIRSSESDVTLQNEFIASPEGGNDQLEEELSKDISLQELIKRYVKGNYLIDPQEFGTSRTLQVALCKRKHL